MFKKIGLGLGLISASVSAFAVPVDVSALTTAVDFSTTTTAILAVAALTVAVYVAWKAAKLVIGAVRGL
jgi:ABC-type antimicrobial peptide transport system permease subunit